MEIVSKMFLRSESNQYISANRFKKKLPFIGGAVKWKNNWEYLYRSVAYTFTMEVLLNNHKIGELGEESNVVQLIIIYVFLGLPLFYTQIILGQYSQMGVLCFRDMLPIARGLPYTMVIVTFMDTIKYSIWLGDAMLYFLATFQRRLPWMYCPEDSPKIVNDLYGNKRKCFDDKNLVNCSHSCLTANDIISSRHYYKAVFLGISDTSTIKPIFPPINRAVAYCAGWVIIFIFVQAIFLRYKKILLIQVVLASVGIVMLCTGTISAGGGKTGISYLFKNIWSVFKYQKTWIKAISKVVDGLSLGQPFIMTTGAKFLPKQNITAIVVEFALLRSVLSSFCSLFYQSIIGMMAHKTKTDILQTELFQLPYEFLAFFITIPQGLGYLTVPQVWNMIYFSYVITVLLMNIVSRIVAIGSMITDVHSFILKYAKYLLAIYCMVSLIVGMFSIGEKHYMEACYFISYIIGLLELFNVTYFSLMVYCVYGVTKLSDDIQFLTGSPPTKFWKFCWYTLPLVLVYAFYEEFCNHVQVKREKVGIHYLINIIVVLCMIPIPICWIIEVINHLRSRYLIGMFRSTDSWGPADPEDRHKRLSFNPRLQTKYQSRSATCNHHCFISYKGLQILHHEETRCREAFLDEFVSGGLPKKSERRGSIKRSVALDVLDRSK